MKFKFLGLLSVWFVCIAWTTASPAAPSVLSARFGAPVINGIFNATPEYGDIVLDSSNGGFFGYGAGGSTSWGPLSLSTPKILVLTTCPYVPSPSVLYIRVRLVGGGGAGENDLANSGGQTSFGTSPSWIECGGGGAASGSTGGAGGTCTVNLGSGFWLAGGSGETIAGTYSGGGAGGSSALGGGGGGGYSGASTYSSGASAAPGTGAGGGGTGGVPGASGAGGGAGGYAESVILSPLASSYSCAIGSGGNSGFAIGSGASGSIIVEEHYY